MSAADTRLPGPRSATLDFWFDFASTYSYLSAMRIDALAARHGVAVRWRPFLLGPIFAGQGWQTSPFNVYPAKGRYMVRDITRIAADRGLAFRMPDVFPAHTVAAARHALAGDAGWIAGFSRAVFEAEFARGLDISNGDVLAALARETGGDAPTLAARASSAAVKAALRTETDTARALGIFGAPSFVTPDGELFWGDDRLDHALRWCTS